MFKLLIEGFKTKAQVEAFVDWYEGQGEQNAVDWFMCRKQEGKIDVSSMSIVLQKNKWNGDTLAMKVDPQP